MHHEQIVIRGAKEHNLKNIDVTIPRFKLIVITGVSGSGKSSLAFDTLYAEGQRRYVESLSSYARQFIGQMDKPKVDFIGGLSPAIAIEQKAVSRNPRSTVGTVTEVHDYLRVLFARAGIPHCPQCGREVQAQSAQEIVRQLSDLRPGARFQILAPVARNRKGTFKEVFAEARAQGFARARVDGTVIDVDADIPLEKNKKHNIELVVDRLVVPTPTGERTSPLGTFVTRLTDSVETALRTGGGTVVVDLGKDGDRLLSEHNACPVCDISFPDLTPPMFSFNSPMGMCPECNGLGTKVEFDPHRFVEPSKSAHDGGIRTWGELRKKKRSGTYQVAQKLVNEFGHDLDTPWELLSPECQNAILYGGTRVRYRSESSRGNWEGEWIYEGTLNATRRRYHQTKSEYTRRWYSSFMSQQVCPECRGQRLRRESVAVTVGDLTIVDFTSMSIREALVCMQALPEQLSVEQREIAQEVLREISGRLQFLLNVGLHYLTLDRSAPSLSGGEGQRIRLASQIGCGLVGVLYVLDEPSIGLHARDHQRLLETLLELRDLGNTVVVVEHDEQTMLAADWLIDLGPGAGVNGGHVIAAGPPQAVKDNPASITGLYLRGERNVGSPNGERRPVNSHWLSLFGATRNNLKNLTVRFPLGLFTCVTGVSGSGKSSLVAQTLYPALSQALQSPGQKAADAIRGTFERLDGLDQVSKVINITQSPIGRTPRSNPASYAQVLTHIRDLLALTPDAKARGYKPGRFSFNVKGGRCEACRGHGRRKVEMHFLPDIWVRCNTCLGTRYNSETLQIRYKGNNISDILNMDVCEALDFFSSIPKIHRILQTLSDVGLGYIKLGQSATTLSGGEAQRVKLAKELARVSTGGTIYILDEPTTGLHFADIQRLLDVLHRLTDSGNTVIVIEHNLDVVKTADWIIDLGPEGGDGGGQIVAQGPPETLITMTESHTGQALGRVLARSGYTPVA